MQAGEDGWRDVIDVNLTGAHNTVEMAIPTMIEQGGGGSIVLISSVAGLAGHRQRRRRARSAMRRRNTAWSD